MVMRLAHLHFRHPIKNFARIEIAENPALELHKKRRMNRITEIEERVWSRESIEQLPFRHSNAIHAGEIVRVGCGFLIQQTVSATQAVLAQSSLEVRDPGLISARIVCRRYQLQPDGVEFQSPQSEHPLQRHGENATAFAIFRGK